MSARKGCVFQTEITFRVDPADGPAEPGDLSDRFEAHVKHIPSLIDWCLVYGHEGPEDFESQRGANPYQGTNTLGVTLLIVGDPENWLVDHIHLTPEFRHYTMPKNAREVRVGGDYAEGDMVVRRVEYVVSPKLLDWDDSQEGDA